MKTAWNQTKTKQDFKHLDWIPLDLHIKSNEHQRQNPTSDQW